MKMVTIDKAQQIVSVAGTSLHALDAIGSALSTVIDASAKPTRYQFTLDQILGVLGSAVAVVDSIKRGIAGDHSDPVAVITASIEALHRSVGENDASVADAIDKKFPPA